MVKLVKLRRALIVSLLLPACHAMESDDESGLKHFFRQATRGGAQRSEAAFMGRLRGCSAFFVANDQGKNLVITARHCVKFRITEWCGSEAGIVVEESTGETRRCERVVAADASRDIAMIEVGGSGRDGLEAVRLAAFSPRPRSRLYMVGYPADSQRRGTLTATRNCWIHRSSVPSPHLGAPDGNQTQDRSYTHNCSTFGGNSGGPMLLEGTKIAVGLPFTYLPAADQGLVSSENGEAYGAQMAEFVAMHRATLQAEGVKIVESQDDVGKEDDGDRDDDRRDDLVDPLKKDVFALVAADDSFYLSLPQGTESARLCLGRETCDQDDGFPLVRYGRRGDREIFSAVRSLPEEGTIFTISGFAGQAKTTRAILQVAADR